MPDLFEEFRAVVSDLTTAGVPFAVCGGIAMSIHAHPRATVDIDLLVPSVEIPRLVEALAPLGFERRERSPSRLAGGAVVLHGLTKVVSRDPDVLVLDAIEVRAGATAQAWETRVGLSWEGTSLSVVSRTGLVALKRLRGSLQDLADIATLEQGG
jgi:hypothetical protein